jgi:hypothetical protein
VQQPFFDSDSRANRPLEEKRNSAGIPANWYGRQQDRWNSCRFELRSNFRPEHHAWSDHDSWSDGSRINHNTGYDSAGYCFTDARHSCTDSRDSWSNARHGNIAARLDYSGNHTDQPHSRNYADKPNSGNDANCESAKHSGKHEPGNYDARNHASRVKSDFAYAGDN